MAQLRKGSGRGPQWAARSEDPNAGSREKLERAPPLAFITTLPRGLHRDVI